MSLCLTKLCQSQWRVEKLHFVASLCAYCLILIKRPLSHSPHCRCCRLQTWSSSCFLSQQNPGCSPCLFYVKGMRNGHIILRPAENDSDCRFHFQTWNLSNLARLLKLKGLERMSPTTTFTETCQPLIFFEKNFFFWLLCQLFSNFGNITLGVNLGVVMRKQPLKLHLYYLFCPSCSSNKLKQSKSTNPGGWSSFL